MIAKQESTTELYTSLTDEEGKFDVHKTDSNTYFAGSGSMAHNFVSLEDGRIFIWFGYLFISSCIFPKHENNRWGGKLQEY